VGERRCHVVWAACMLLVAWVGRFWRWERNKGGGKREGGIIIIICMLYMYYTAELTTRKRALSGEVQRTCITT
jgi:hypothetical protein